MTRVPGFIPQSPHRDHHAGADTTAESTPAAPAAPAPAAPVAESQRNRLIDALRGVALLGILLMNIPGFAMPESNIEASFQRMKVEPIPWIGLIYPFQRILLVLAHTSALILLYKAGVFAKLFRALEAVGQTAFTNYIMHSVICTLFFFGYGLNFYGELQLYQLYFVVAVIWAFQLVVSPLWLQYFRFGPLEWLWRSLTYWKVQPFRRRPEKTEVEAPAPATVGAPPG